MTEVFINSISQISVQKPLCNDWFLNPLTFENQELVFAQDPDFKRFLPQNLLRRNTSILKRAMVVSQNALEKSGLKSLQAIIVGSGLGCVESTESFLKDLFYNGEDFLKPSFFMQSTHNTIASVIAVYLKCNGYNSTYCHNGLSFESALSDAFLQIKTAKISNAFVGGFDEMSSTYFNILKRQGYLNFSKIGFAGQASCGMIISKEKTLQSCCKISNLDMIFSDDISLADEMLKNQEFDLCLCGYNGNPENDKVYDKLCKNYCRGVYKNVFGESYSAVSYAVLTAQEIIKNNFVPDFLLLDKKVEKEINKILIFNHYNAKEFSFILIEKC